MEKPKGWRNDSREHAMARKGISTKEGMQSRGRISGKVEKFNKGDIVGFEGMIYIVEDSSYTSHPEYLIGGERAKEGFYAQLIPLEAEDISGWVNQSRIKTLTEKEKMRIREEYKEEIDEIEKQFDLKASGNQFEYGKEVEEVIELMRKEKIPTDSASPNFVKDFADNRGISLDADEVVEISNQYELKASGLSDERIVIRLSSLEMSKDSHEQEIDNILTEFGDLSSKNELTRVKREHLEKRHSVQVGHIRQINNEIQFLEKSLSKKDKLKSDGVFDSLILQAVSPITKQLLADGLFFKTPEEKKHLAEAKRIKKEAKAEMKRAKKEAKEERALEKSRKLAEKKIELEKKKAREEFQAEKKAEIKALKKEVGVVAKLKGGIEKLGEKVSISDVDVTQHGRVGAITEKIEMEERKVSREELTDLPEEALTSPDADSIIAVAENKEKLIGYKNELKQDIGMLEAERYKFNRTFDQDYTNEKRKMYNERELERKTINEKIRNLKVSTLKPEVIASKVSELNRKFVNKFNKREIEIQAMRLRDSNTLKYMSGLADDLKKLVRQADSRLQRYLASGVKKTKKFNGKQFNKHVIHPTRTSATREANKLRKEGWNARVVEEEVTSESLKYALGTDTGYVIYRRRK